MRLKLNILFLVVAWFPVIGQDLTEFDEVSLDDLKMSRYVNDSSASAVILFDKGEARLEPNSSVTFKRHVRIKILTTNGLEWANIEMAMARSYQKLTKIKGVTYNLEDGKKTETPLEESGIFKSKYNKYVDVHKFVLPNVKVGSVIEYSVVIRIIDSMIPDWHFQYPIPVLKSDFISWVDPFLVKKQVQGFLPVDMHEEKAKGYEHFGMTNIPAFKEEPFCTTPQDYISKIHFYSSTRSWKSIINDYYAMEEFGGQVRGSYFLQKIVDELTTGITDSLKRVRVIYDYVKSNVDWDGVTDRIPDNTFKKVLANKKGTSSEINLLLVTMLRKAKVSAYPMFISTRDNGMVRYLQNQVGQFNDLICFVEIGSKMMFIDATDKDLPLTAVPERCLNGIGLILSEEGARWEIVKAARSRRVINTEFKLDTLRTLTGQLSIASDGLAAGKERKKFRRLGEEKYKKFLLDGKNWEAEKTEFRNMTSPETSTKASMWITINENTVTHGAVIYLNPFVIDRIEENQFKDTERHFPVDFATPFEEINMCKITIDKRFEIEELPQPKAIALAGNSARYSYNIVRAGNSIAVTSQFIINRNVFMPDEYALLREFINHVIAKQSEQIVLRLKSRPSDMVKP